MALIFIHALGYLLLLCIVGLAWVYAIFRKDEINTVEGIVVGLGLSLFLVPLCFFYLVEFLNFKVTLLNSVLLILFLTLAGALIAARGNWKEVRPKIGWPGNAEEIIVALFLILSASFVILGMNYVGFSPDEAWYLSTSLNLYKYGEYMSYTWAPETYRGPIFPVFIAMSYALYGFSFYSAWLVAKVFGILSIVSCYLTGRLFFDRKTGIVASVLLLSSTIVAIQYSNRVLTDLPLVVYFLINISVLYLAVKKENPKIGFIGGALAGVSYMLKEPGILAFLVLLVYSIPHLKKYQNVLLASASGLFVSLLPWIYHIYKATNTFAVTGYLNERVFLIVFVPLILVVMSALIVNKIQFSKEGFSRMGSGFYVLFLISVALIFQVRYQYLSFFLKTMKTIPYYTSELFVLFSVIGLIYSLYMSISDEKYAFLILSFLFGSFYGLVINQGYNYANMGYVRYIFFIFAFLMIFCSIFINKSYREINKKSKIFASLFILCSVFLLSYFNFASGTSIHGYSYDYSYDPRPGDLIECSLGSFSKGLLEDDVLVTPTGGHFVYFFVDGNSPVYDTPARDAFLNGEWDSKRLRGWIVDFDYFVYIEKFNYRPSPWSLEDFDELGVSDLLIPQAVESAECNADSEVWIFKIKKSSS
jgi:4-amino-4-deoxy-L-arabinose transferase-like glycosyltransferase